MSDIIKDGGPAFAQWEGHAITGAPLRLRGGATMRDLFALAALPALVARITPDDLIDDHAARQTCQRCGKGAYALADAMIAERSK